MDEMVHGAPTWADLMAGWDDLYRDAVVCAAIAGLMLGFLSAYVVLRRMVFVSAAVSQAAGLGVALAFYAGLHWGVAVPPGYAAIGLALATAGLLALDPRPLGLSREVVLGLVFALAGGAAVLVAENITQDSHEIEDILFGAAVLVDPADLRRVAVIAVVLLALHTWWFRGVAFAGFDPVAARVHGLPVRALDAFLFASIGVAVGVSAQAIGALPVFALSTLPGTAALLTARGRLGAVFVLAAIFGAVAGVGGYLLAFFEDWTVGASQTVAAGALVVLAALISGGLALVRRALGARRPPA
jgi:zinc transport system permease protein